MKKLFILFLLMTYTTFANAHSPEPFEVSISGKGSKSLVFIPGYACSAAVWDATIQRYEAYYTCYAFTMTGFAGVPAQPNPKISEWIEAIAHYIKKNNLSNVTLVGHSLGGVISMLLASNCPELVEKMIVVDVLPCLPALQNPNFQAQKQPNCVPYLQQFTAMSDAQFYEMQVNYLKSMVQDTVHFQTVVDWSVNSDRATLANIYCQFYNTDLREVISNIKCPVLVLLEAPFASMQPTIAQQYAKLQDTTLKYAPNGLHFIMYDSPAWYFEQLDTFLKG